MITIIISNYNKKNNILTVPLDISVDLLVGAGDEVEEALPAVRGKYLKTIPPPPQTSFYQIVLGLGLR